MEPPSPTLLAVIVAVSISATALIWRFIQARVERKGHPLPPGPTRVPLLGNIFSIDREKPWETYTRLHPIYGDVFSLRLLNQDVVILGSHSVAVELLEKRSHLYSDRPSIATLKPYGIDCIFAFHPYGEHWRSCRRIVHHTYRADAALSLRPTQLRKARQLIMNMIENPDCYEHHYIVFSSAVSLAAAYDYDVEGQDDPLVKFIEELTAAAVPATTPGRVILLTLFPFLLYIPDWCPGSSLKREAKRAHELSDKLTEIPFQYVEERMKAHDKRPIVSMVSDQVTRMDKHIDQSDRAKFFFTLKKAAVSTILAGSETMASSIMVFTLAMVLNPRVWRRAQTEIDAVIGTDRLPDFDDRPTLPYVDAIIRETVRWRPVVPLGVWHATSNSDVYNGHYIPKGTTVVANAWAMSRDEARFPNAENFVPERFLNEQGMLNENDPLEFVFGYGRRMCPGRYAADASLFASIATMLATLEFYPPEDVEGSSSTFHVGWVNGITHRPASFPCRISPRAHVNKSYLAELR